MKATMLRRIPDMLGIFVLTVLGLAVAPRAFGQYQAVFGGAERDAGTGGIIQVSDASFIAVGWATSFSGDSDVYVVKSDLCGKLLWARTYDIGGNDEGKKIRETRDGGFIIAGVTQNLRTCCPNEEGWTPDEGFLLKITGKGDVEWARTYGGQDHDDMQDVLPVPGGDGYYAVGRSASFGAGRYDGWLMQVTDLGHVVWSRTYGEYSRDGLYSLAIGSDSSLIAVGETVSFSPSGSTHQDIFVVKARASDGELIWSNYYRAPAAAFAGSILLDEPVAGDPVFYVAGLVNRNAGTGYDAYILKAKYSNGAVLGDVAFHHQVATSNVDDFREIKKLPTGNLIAVGSLGPAVLLPDYNYDFYLAEVDQGLAPVWHRAYGGRYYDQGWSVAVGFSPSLRYTLMALGFTNSFGFGDLDLYQVYATSAGVSGCNERIPAIDRFVPGLTAMPAEINTSKVWVECPVKVVVVKDDHGRVLCTDCKSLDDQLNDTEFSEGMMAQ